MTTKVEPIECAVIVSERDNHAEVSFRETEAEWLSRLEAAGIDSATLRYVPAVIVPLAEYERLKRYDARTMPISDLYDVYDERLQDSICEES